MLKAGDLARREDRRVKGVKIGKTRRDRGISHVCPIFMLKILKLSIYYGMYGTLNVQLRSDSPKVL